METDVQNDDLNVSLKQDAALENGKYTIFVEIINWVYILRIVLLIKWVY